MTDSEMNTLRESGMVIERTRFIRTGQADTLFKTAASIVIDMFSSQADVQGIMEAELIYLESELEVCHIDRKPTLTNTIAAYRRAVELLRILKDEPEIYRKYCVPACTIMKRKGKRGIPHDAFHYALALHKMWFECDALLHLSREDRDIMHLRLKNLNTAWKLYIDLQRKVMGLRDYESPKIVDASDIHDLKDLYQLADKVVFRLVNENKSLVIMDDEHYRELVAIIEALKGE